MTGVAVPIGYDEMIRTYGDPLGVALNDPVAVERWRAKICTIITLPSPLHTPAGPQIHLACHRIVAPDLIEILPEIWPDVESIECFAARKSRTTEKISTHFWAIALDINAAKNRLGAKPNQPARIVEAFRKRRWVWGGNWPTPDGMHFQRVARY